MRTFLILGIIGVVILAISVFVYSQFMTPKKPPKWTYLGMIIGVILILIAIFFAFYPPVHERPVAPVQVRPVPVKSMSTKIPLRPVSPVGPIVSEPVSVGPVVRNVAVVPPPLVKPVSGFDALRP